MRGGKRGQDMFVNQILLGLLEGGGGGADEAGEAVTEELFLEGKAGGEEVGGQMGIVACGGGRGVGG